MRDTRARSADARLARIAVITTVPLIASGCIGMLEDSAALPRGVERPGMTPGATCEARAAGEPDLLRLSETQYRNTLRDLIGGPLGTELAAMSTYPAGAALRGGFSSDADANVVNTAESNAIEDNAELLASELLERADAALPALMPCAPSGFSDAQVDGCIDEFIASFGLRAFRRPPTDGERAIARALYDQIRAEQGAREAWSALMQLFLQAPALLYRTERGEGLADGTTLIALSDWEMATRLAYFFTDSMPDAELFAAAEAGALSTPDQVAAHADRLAHSPRAESTIARFHREWLRLDRLETLAKDTTVFPEYSPEVRAAMQAEGDAIVRWTLEEGGGNYRALMSSEALPIDPALADLYEAPAGSRRGILTSASFMAAHARESTTHPIERGAFFLREILCGSIPPFPAGIDTAGPLESTAHLPTARERLAPLLERSDCMGCHTAFNPIGLAFEQYDAIGRFRATENSAPIDASGEIDLDGASVGFEDARELVALAAESDAAQHCYTRHWLRFALGRRETDDDMCSLDSVDRAFAESGGDIRAVMIATTRTDAFRYRPITEATE